MTSDVITIYNDEEFDSNEFENSESESDLEILEIENDAAGNVLWKGYCALFMTFFVLILVAEYPLVDVLYSNF